MIWKNTIQFSLDYIICFSIFFGCYKNEKKHFVPPYWHGWWWTYPQYLLRSQVLWGAEWSFHFAVGCKNADCKSSIPESLPSSIVCSWLSVPIIYNISSCFSSILITSPFFYSQKACFCGWLLPKFAGQPSKIAVALRTILIFSIIWRPHSPIYFRWTTIFWGLICWWSADVSCIYRPVMYPFTHQFLTTVMNFTTPQRGASRGCKVPWRKRLRPCCSFGRKLWLGEGQRESIEKPPSCLCWFIARILTSSIFLPQTLIIGVISQLSELDTIGRVGWSMRIIRMILRMMINLTWLQPWKLWQNRALRIYIL